MVVERFVAEARSISEQRFFQATHFPPGSSSSFSSFFIFPRETPSIQPEQRKRNDYFLFFFFFDGATKHVSVNNLSFF